MELKCWKSLVIIVQIFGAANWGEHALSMETAQVKVGTFQYIEDKAVDIFNPPETRLIPDQTFSFMLTDRKKTLKSSSL